MLFVINNIYGSRFSSLFPSCTVFQNTKTGMTRDEVNAIRLYFARSVDRYIERRRVMLRATQQLRSSINNLDARLRGTRDSQNQHGSSTSRQRSDTGESNNSLLDVESNEGVGTNTVDGGGGAQQVGTGSNIANTNGGDSGDSNRSGSPIEGEEILYDRRRMEDEWMSLQVR